MASHAIDIAIAPGRAGAVRDAATAADPSADLSFGTIADPRVDREMLGEATRARANALVVATTGDPALRITPSRDRASR